MLHDSTGQYWTDGELIDYINDGRNWLVAKTGCNRMIQTGTLVAGQEAYAFTFCGQNDTFDILNIKIQWGSMLYQLDYAPFGDLSTKYRSWSTWKQRPVIFSVYGQNTIYVSPVPDQAYSVELDTVVAPAPLVLPTDQDFISFPFVPAISFYAAYLAKFKEQSYDEAERFKREAILKAIEASGFSFTRRIASMYTQ